MIFAYHFSQKKFTDKSWISVDWKMPARSNVFNRLFLRLLWASESLFKVAKPPPWRFAGTERLSLRGNRQVNFNLSIQLEKYSVNSI